MTIFADQLHRSAHLHIITNDGVINTISHNNLSLYGFFCLSVARTYT